MNPFTLCCTTCLARLRVQRAEAIGQILPCPKCGSMVMVQPSADAAGVTDAPRLDSTENPSSSVDVAAHIRTGTLGQAIGPSFDQVDELLGNAPLESGSTMPASETAEQPAVPCEPPPRAVIGAPASAGQTGEGSASGETTVAEASDAGHATHNVTSAVAAGSSSALESENLDGGNLVPGQSWMSPSLHAWRTWMLVAASATLGVIATVGVLHLTSKPQTLTREDSAPEAVHVDHTDSTTPAEPAIEPKRQIESTQPQTDRSSGNPTIGQEPLSPTGSSAAADEETSPDDGSTDTNRGTGLGPRGDVTPETPPPDSSSASTAALPQPPAPLDDQRPGTGTPATEPSATADAPARPSGDRLAAQANPSPATPRVKVETTYKPVTRAPRRVDVQARLADKIVALQSRYTPLVRFLRSISQFSTIPITLDPESVSMVGMSANSPISIDQQGTTVGDVLRLTLKPKKLVCEMADDHLIVRSLYSVNRRLVSWQPPVSDLAGDPQEMRTLVEHIRRIVAPASWQPRGGDGTIQVQANELTIAQTADVHYQIYVLCEKLRMARGQLMLGKKNRQQFRLDTRSARARKTLDSKISLRYVRNAPFRSVMGRLEETTGATLLVDWYALSQQGWNGDTEVTLAVDDTTLKDAMQSLLVPMRLTYRAVDESTLQITSELALSAQPELEFYAVGDLTRRRNGGGATGQQVVARLSESLDRDYLSQDGGITFDEKSQCLLVLLPQPLHQVVVEKLAELRRRR